MTIDSFNDLSDSTKTDILSLIGFTSGEICEVTDENMELWGLWELDKNKINISMKY